MCASFTMEQFTSEFRRLGGQCFTQMHSNRRLEVRVLNTSNPELEANRSPKAWLPWQSVLLSNLSCPKSGNLLLRRLPGGASRRNSFSVRISHKMFHRTFQHLVNHSRLSGLLTQRLVYQTERKPLKGGGIAFLLFLLFMFSKNDFWYNYALCEATVTYRRTSVRRHFCGWTTS